jgi:hypothetical protein
MTRAMAGGYTAAEYWYTLVSSEYFATDFLKEATFVYNLGTLAIGCDDNITFLLRETSRLQSKLPLDLGFYIRGSKRS